MNIYQPYTYLIGWSVHNKWYYGVRYSKKSNPKELWNKYFTSSQHVKRFRNKHGEPDIIQVRKIFDNPQKALMWEQKVLLRMNVEKDKRFLNAKNSTTSSVISNPNISSFKKGNIPWNKNLNLKNILSEDQRKKYGRKISEEEKKILSDKNKKRFENAIERENLRQKAFLQYNDPIQIEKHKEACIKSNAAHKNTVWINNGVINKRIDKMKLTEYNEWIIGRIIPDDIKTKMKNSRKVKK